MYDQARRGEVRTAQLQARLREAQLTALRSQLQPHFLFNTLQAATTSIYDDPQFAEEILLSLSELLRISLQAFERQEIPVRDEIEYLRHYAAIQKRRFGDRSEDCLRQLCQELWRDSGVSLEPALKGQPVRVVDATVVKEPGKTGGQWRIHYSMRLPSLECDQFDLTPTQGKSTGEKLGRFKFQKGEVILADAGYSNPPGIAAVVNAGADVCVRMNRASLHLQDQKDRPFPLLRKLKPLRKAGETAEWQVSITSGRQRITGRLCGIRKSEDAIKRAQRRLVIRQQDGRGRVTPENEEYACYVLVFTTLAKSRASAAQVLECYRLRWQIELVFKRLKSLVQLGHIPKHDDQSSRAWLYGKLFVALLSQKLTRVGRSGSPWGYYLPEQTASPEPMA